jgi:hypothetical protein
MGKDEGRKRMRRWGKAEGRKWEGWWWWKKEGWKLPSKLACFYTGG